jgi:hypothetical protein
MSPASDDAHPSASPQCQADQPGHAGDRGGPHPATPRVGTRPPVPLKIPCAPHTPPPLKG